MGFNIRPKRDISQQWKDDHCDYNDECEDEEYDEDECEDDDILDEDLEE